MKPSVLGHEKAMSPETVWARVEAWSMERPGRPETAACPWGVLSGIVVGDGESPLLRRKDPTEVRSPYRQLAPDMQDRDTASQPPCGE